ncbi:MAG: hypothetical protein ACI4LX_05425 [Treponema sp.]
MKNFSVMNKIAKKHQAVFFGSTQLSQMDLNEILEDSSSLKVYNRSIEKLDIENVSIYVMPCVIELAPAKLFINIGEEDIKSPSFNQDSFISKYEWLLYQLHKNCSGCTLYIVPVVSAEKKVAELNSALEKLSFESGCIFVKLNGMTVFHLLTALKQHLRDFPITFADAMQYIG